jgi:hypothetical protein
MNFDSPSKMLSIHFTLAQVVNMLRIIAEREPERVGKSGSAGCVYGFIDKGVLTPVCIVGQMFADLGLLRLLLVSPSDLTDGSYGTANLSACSIGSGFWEDLSRFGITADEDAKAFMHSVQRKQDDDYVWGEAFNAAVQEYRAEQQAILDSRLSNLFG